MFQVLNIGTALPMQFPVDPAAEFQPGYLAQLKLHGNNLVCGVSDGTAPIGVIDDIKSNAFYTTSIDEVVIQPVTNPVTSGGNLVSPYDLKYELLNPNITANSFISSAVDVTLNPRNGVITFLAGTPLNFSYNNNGIPDSIRTVVSYTYQIPNIPGDNTTASSGMVTVWYQKMICQTDQFDTTARYAINAPLFCNAEGKLTTQQIAAEYPAIGIVLAPAGAINNTLQFMFL